MTKSQMPHVMSLNTLTYSCSLKVPTKQMCKFQGLDFPFGGGPGAGAPQNLSEIVSFFPMVSSLENVENLSDFGHRHLQVMHFSHRIHSDSQDESWPGGGWGAP